MDIFFWILVWLVSWFVCLLVAIRRGQSEMLGCLTGAVLGPIGIVLLLAMQPGEGVQEQRRLVRGHKRCPFCAEVIKAEATVCRYCGRDLPTVP